ncbi:RibD family protein [Aquabacter cavernae]|uniref:RibD family protein n=1 Tax=Aquabacter cavernae TaxID=2496029 RepID=UPI000F8ED438|nr:RibD family protein [Aquabacter cavernae]
MKPHIICHMVTSLDGRLHPSGWTRSPDGDRATWSEVYERIHAALEPDAWMVGRTTLAEMARAEPHPPADFGAVARSQHLPVRGAQGYAIAIDPSGKLHFSGPTLGGDAVVVLLGNGIADSHLAELAADGISYLVADGPEMDLAAMLETLGRELGIRRLLLEGGAKTNGALLAAGLVDEFSLVLTPTLDGRPAIAAIVDAGPEGLAGKVELSLISCENAGNGCFHLRYAVGRG